MKDVVRHDRAVRVLRKHLVRIGIGTFVLGAIALDISYLSWGEESRAALLLGGLGILLLGGSGLTLLLITLLPNLPVAGHPLAQGSSAIPQTESNDSVDDYLGKIFEEEIREENAPDE